MLKSRLKKSAPECPFECGGGGVNAIWAMPKWRWWQAERGFPKSQVQKQRKIYIVLEPALEITVEQGDLNKSGVNPERLEVVRGHTMQWQGHKNNT